MALYLYLPRYRDMTFLELSDRLVIASLPAAALIRVGNFFNSEILGMPTNLPWAIIFIRVDATPRHPAMLYEAIVYALLFCILYAAYWKRNIINTPGCATGTIFVTSSIARFFMEFLKEEQVSFEQAMPLNMGQLLSIPFLGLGLVLLWRRCFRRLQI